MDIFSLLNPQRITCNTELGSKKKVLETLSELLAADITSHSQAQIFDNLIMRERLGSTGLGSGVALPHCRLSGITEPYGALLTLNQAVDFDSPDQKGVDIVFSLVVPEDSNEEHLQILAHLAKLFSDHNLCSQLREATNVQGILDVIDHWQHSAAA